MHVLTWADKAYNGNDAHRRFASKRCESSAVQSNPPEVHNVIFTLYTPNLILSYHIIYRNEKGYVNWSHIPH